MVLAILLSLAAGFCTATASVCQRLGARSLDAREPGVTGCDPMLVFRLAQRGVRRREWLAAVAMSVGLSVFLRVASPSGGQPHASALSWWISGLLVLAAGVAALSHSDLISSHPAARASGTPRRDRSPMELMRKSR